MPSYDRVVRMFFQVRFEETTRLEDVLRDRDLVDTEDLGDLFMAHTLQPAHAEHLLAFSR